MTFTGREAASDPELDPGREGHRLQRAELRARLAAERAELLCSLLGTEVDVLESEPLQGTISASGLLSAVAIREFSFADQLSAPPAMSPTATSTLTDAECPPTGFDEALARCIGARSRFLDAFARVPDDVLFDAPTVGTLELTPLTMATQCHWSDASLSLRANAWSRDQGLGDSIGPPSLLRAAIRAARKELLTTIALVPELARELSIFEGGRSLPQVFRMVVSLERTFLDSLVHASLATQAAHVEATPNDSTEWSRAWSDLHTTHAALTRVLDAADPAEFEAPIEDTDGGLEPVYTWARGCLLHDRLHAGRIRAVLELDWPERLLR